MNDILQAPWLFVIDTTDYAGNFERELCAYITGCVGECEVGDDMAELFKEETKKEPFENLQWESDEHGCARPASIYPTPAWFNNGMGFQFQAGEEDKALKAYIKDSVKYETDHMQAPIHHLKTLEKGTDKEKEELRRIGWTKASCLKAIKDYKKEIEKIKKTKKVSHYPSCQSVAISFDTKPTEEQIKLMKERAFKFASLKSKWGEEVRIKKITGFRLIKNVIKKEPEETSV